MKWHTGMQKKRKMLIRRKGSMIGIVDIGSNTIRLSCYEIQPDNKFSCVIHKKEVAGLAGYIDEKGNMTEEGIERTIKAIETFKGVIEHIELESIHFFATAAIRNTINCEKIVSRIQLKTGYVVHVLSGEEEAVCDFVGVCGDNNVQNGMVVDIGGGSTEIVSFENRMMVHGVSLSVGSLNTYKEYVKNVVPTKTELSQIRKNIKGVLVTERKNVNKAEVAYGVGGSIRAILKLYNEEYKMDDGNRDMKSGKLKKLLELYGDNKNYLIDRIIKTAPDRLHTIIPGLTILCTVVKYYNLNTVHVSRYGVREGYLMRYVLNKKD